jgi:uncharacterized membrane protein YdfJ with MMPL/SSD domain
MGRLGRTCFRYRKSTLLGWLLAVACLITLWLRFGAAADNTFTGSDPGQAILNQHFARQSGDTLTLAIRSAQPIGGTAETGIERALTPFRDAADVTGVSNLNVARNGRIAYATIQFDVTTVPAGEAKTLMNDATKASGNGVTYNVGGDAVDLAETPYGGPSNGIGVAAAAIVLLIAFGSLLAMGLPIATALMGIGSGLSLIALLGHIFPAPSFSAIVAALIGLGVGVDYALFIVTRFRAELHEHHAPEEAVVTAMRTAGKSVLTAGTTVSIGMLGLLVLRQPLLNGVAIAAAATVAMTVLASLTLLPALLALISQHSSGTRLARPPRLRMPWSTKRGTGRSTTVSSAEKWASVVQRHPVAAASLAASVVLAIAAPMLAMKLAMPDESAQARGTMGYASYATMADGFGPGFDAPLIVAGPPDLTAVHAAVAGTHGIAAVTPVQVSTDGKAGMFIAYPSTGEQDPATNALVNTLRAELPSGTYLTGPNAANVSFANLIGQRMPWLIGIVIALSMVLLTSVFRSVAIAVKAAVMNLLSVCAAYGVLTAVVQWGWAGKLFGFPEKMPVTTWVPVFLFVILFGLSMDYEVFLLSRIRESWLATGDNSVAVRRGLASSARVISAAAAIMVVVFLSSVLTPDVSVKQIGLGLAAAVLIDATLVRLVLVPAVMELLGRANWWLPSWLGGSPEPPSGTTSHSPAVTASR